MKNTTKLFGIIAFVALIMVSTVFISCGSSVSGTFVLPDDPNYTLTFKGKNVVGKYKASDLSGTFTIVDNKLTIDASGFGSMVWTIIDKDTLKDGFDTEFKKIK